MVRKVGRKTRVVIQLNDLPSGGTAGHLSLFRGGQQALRRLPPDYSRPGRMGAVYLGGRFEHRCAALGKHGHAHSKQVHSRTVTANKDTLMLDLLQATTCCWLHAAWSALVKLRL